MMPASAAAPDTLATVPAADQPTLGRIHDVLHWKFENLDRAPRRKDHAATEGTLGRLQRQLFSDHATVSHTPRDNEVEVFSAPGESRECVEVARRVLALARDGIPFDRIAVLLRSPEEYRAHLQEAFARASIPAHFARGAVRPDPAGRAFYSLLKCAAEGLSARRFAEYLSLSLRCLTPAPAARRPRPRRGETAGSSRTRSWSRSSRMVPPMSQ
jgi:hypothetical protein